MMPGTLSLTNYKQAWDPPYIGKWTSTICLPFMVTKHGHSKEKGSSDSFGTERI